VLTTKLTQFLRSLKQFRRRSLGTLHSAIAPVPDDLQAAVVNSVPAISLNGGLNIPALCGFVAAINSG
jgi:hypothetical protein